LKNVAVAIDGMSARGDVIVTSSGLEGGPIYSLSMPIRAALDRGQAVVSVDLQPDLSLATLADRLARRRPKDSLSSTLKRVVGLRSPAVAWLREVVGTMLPSGSDELAALLKAVPVHIQGLVAIDRAISTAGGVSMDEVDDHFMLHRMPGTFVVGEMLDWEAPTGGFLLQATFATAVAAASGAITRVG
jgi:predicted flavoprotein YhiN